MNIRISYKEILAYQEVIDAHILDDDMLINSVSFDSRLEPSSDQVLFIAIIGEQFDAHTFLEQAINARFSSFTVSCKDSFEHLKKKNTQWAPMITLLPQNTTLEIMCN